jgi:hypothetical protein
MNNNRLAVRLPCIQDRLTIMERVLHRYHENPFMAFFFLENTGEHSN